MVETRQQKNTRMDKEDKKTTTNMPNKDLVFQSQMNTIESFTGASTQNAHRWLTHATNILRIQGFNDSHELVNLLSGFLDEEALNWFQDYRPKFTHWNEFHAALTQRFPSPPTINNTFESFQQLSNRRQGLDEPTVDYYAHVLKLCHSYNPAMSAKEQVDHLKKGLRPSLLDKVLDRDPVTPADFIAVVLKVESNQRILQSQFELETTSNNHQHNNNNSDHFTIDQSRSTAHSHDQKANYGPQQHSQRQQWSGQQQQRRQPGSSGGPICYTCGKPGHISPACYLNWQ